MICPNCKGNGFMRHDFEAETHITQCKACNSEGEVSDDKYYRQTYMEKNWLGKDSQTAYHGPCLDHTLFRKLRIVLN
jgi:hypothetical protein